MLGAHLPDRAERASSLDGYHHHQPGVYHQRIPSDRLGQRVVIAASYWGKFKTTFQMVSVVLLILDIPALAFVTTICVWIALVLTIVSLVDYIYKNHKILTEGSI